MLKLYDSGQKSLPLWNYSFYTCPRSNKMYTLMKNPFNLLNFRAKIAWTSWNLKLRYHQNERKYQFEEITKAWWMNELNSYIRKSEVHTFVVTKNLQRKICHLIVHFERPEIIPRKYFQASLYIIALCFIDFDSYNTINI